MKFLVIGLPLILLMTIFLINNEDQKRAERYQYELKFVAEEAAAAAAQYFNKNEYALGKYQFDQVEGTKAAEYVIKKNMNLDDNFVPVGGYWQDKVTYTIQFFDDLNTVYPYLYIHPTNDFTIAIGDPTVVITINAGKARYRLLTPPQMYRTAAHTWQQR